MTTDDVVDTAKTEVGQGDDTEAKPVVPDWQLWPPSPKLQIALIAAVFCLFNVLLVAIFVVVLVKHN